MLTKVLFLITIINYIVVESVRTKSHPDVFLNTKQLIEKYGYPFENHSIQTQDGYILELHRIPLGRKSTARGIRPPVLVVPGLVCDSSVWVNMGRRNSLGFLLADDGYDVWLANYRGTTWSRKHVSLNPDVNRKQFWNFSFHEIAIYDLPAFIDYILCITNQTKLFYIGHSQGTTSIFTLLSMKPDYNKKVRLAITLAPVAYTDHVTSLLTIILPFIHKVGAIIELTHGYELFRYSKSLAYLSDVFCRDNSPIQPMCIALVASIGGYGVETFNKTLFPVISSNVPAGMAYKQILHYIQILKSKLYRQFDYGPIENLITYDQMTPPEYNLSKATSPFALYYGNKDTLSVIKDVERLIPRLPNVVGKSKLKGFAHLDFLWGIHVVKLVYQNFFSLMKNY